MLDLCCVSESALLCSGKMVQMKLLIWLSVYLWCLLDHGVSGVDTEEVSVMEGYPVTLNTGVQTNQQEDIKWYYNDIRIAEINGDQSQICTDVQCKGGDERFRDRLKLDHQTGSLTIMNITNTHSGEYKLKISSGSSDSEKIFSVSVTGASGVDTDGVSAMEGDSVTLYTGVQTNQQHRIRWYYKDIRIAEINRDQSKICTDVHCNEGTERFRGRLKLDHQTGSLTIMNTRNTHSGEYTLIIISSSTESEKIFIVSVTGVSGRDEMKRTTVNEGELVTLDTSVERNPNDVMTWYFSDIRIAEITGDQSQICTDDQCKERFRDRLKLDHQTGSLNITHTRKTHSGEYKLQISNSRFSITKIFSVSVTAVPDSGLSPVDIGAICASAGGCVAVLLVAAAAVIYHHISKLTENRKWRDYDDQENRVRVALN